MKTKKVPQSVKDLIEEGIFFKNDKANVLAWIDAFESIGYNRTDH